MKFRRYQKQVGLGFILAFLEWALLVFLPQPAVQGVMLKQPLMQQPLLYSACFLLVMTLLWSLVLRAYDDFDLRLTGSRRDKASTYTVVCSFIWLLYLMEPLPHQTQLILVVSLLKCLLIFMLLRLLIQKFLASDRYPYKRKAFIYGRALFAFSFCYTCGRLLQYLGLNTYSLETPSNIFAIFWAMVAGLGWGLVFCYLQRYAKKQDKIGKVFIFTFAYALPLLVTYHAQLYFHYDWPLSDLWLRVMIDTLALGLAAYWTVQWQLWDFMDMT